MKRSAIRGQLSAFVLAAFALVMGCERGGAADVPRTDPDGKGTSLGAVCEKLRALRCPEGEVTPTGVTCFRHLTRMNEMVAIPENCLHAAKTIEAVQACGNFDTLRFRCE